MTRTSNTLWLEFRTDFGELNLEEYYQSYTSLHVFPQPHKQTPQIITLIGTKDKAEALQRIGACVLASKSEHGEVHMRVNNDTLNDDSPIIYADCSLHVARPWKRVLAGGWDARRRPLLWAEQVRPKLEPENLAVLTYAKLLSPFSTLFCIFSSDLGGLAGVVKILAEWVRLNTASDLPHTTRPRVLVLESSPSETFDEKLSTRKLLALLAQEMEKHIGSLSKTKLDGFLARHFSDIRVTLLPYDEPRSKYRWSVLKERILVETTDSQTRRRASNTLFSVNHFEAFFHYACDQFSSSHILPFNFILSSRLANPIPKGLSAQVSEFMRMVDSDRDLCAFAAPVLASCLALDSCPPGMHIFDPKLVFQNLYQETCKNALLELKQHTGREVPPEFLELVKHRFSLHLLRIKGGSGIAADSHRQSLRIFKNRWLSFHSNTICFCCLARMPENVLPCGHSFCDVCIRIYGEKDIGEPWTFHFLECILCSRSNTNTFKLKPPTAGVRILTLDGGGIRGVIPLQFLQELEKILGLACPIQEFFDLAVGTSSGGLIVLSMFINGWSTEKCSARFKDLAKLAFRFHCTPALSHFFKIFFSFLRDARCNTSNLENALKEAYGSTQPIFQSVGVKVMVTATTTSNSTTCIFSNYNGQKPLPENCGYRFVRETYPAKEPYVWQAARSSSAAPSFFKAFGRYHDGGLGGHNNPVKLAQWEYQRIWSETAKEPDIFVSLGTGFSRGATGLDETREDCAWKNWFFFRLLRSYMTLLDGEKTWVELWNSLPPRVRGRYHRLNLEFTSGEPPLDAVEAMPELEKQTSRCAYAGRDLISCADNLISSLFYLELEDLPTFHKVQFMCKAYIRCRWGSTHPAFQQLLGRMIKTGAKFYISGKTLPCIDDDVRAAIEDGRPFQRKIEFRVLKLSDPVYISIGGLIARPRDISNCPYVIESLIRDQGLDCPFGRADHQKRKPMESDRNLRKRPRRWYKSSLI